MSNATRLSIPHHIYQTGPANSARWPPLFKSSYGSWQRHNPGFQYTFWNDTRLDVNNPNGLPFVQRHFPDFVPTFSALCYRIMKFDTARYMAMYLHGGIYSDLDVEAAGTIPAALLEAYDVIMPPVQLHRKEVCTFLYRKWDRKLVESSLHLRTTMPSSCPHLGNWWLASRPRHPLWLAMLEHIRAHVGEVCSAQHRRDRHRAILELTGPFALYHVVDEYLRRTGDPRVIALQSMPFLRYHSAASWTRSSHGGQQKLSSAKRGGGGKGATG